MVQVRRIAILVVTGSALITGTLVGPSAVHTGTKASRVVADPCPCDNPVCKPVCRQN
jgi:hypothetical protein